MYSLGYTSTFITEDKDGVKCLGNVHLAEHIIPTALITALILRAARTRVSARTKATGNARAVEPTTMTTSPGAIVADRLNHSVQNITYNRYSPLWLPPTLVDSNQY